MKCIMTLERTTPGAALYREVDEKGNRVPTANAIMGNLYVRLNALIKVHGGTPSKIEVTIEKVA